MRLSCGDWAVLALNAIAGDAGKILEVKVLTGKILSRKELALDSAARNAGWGREEETG